MSIPLGLEAFFVSDLSSHPVHSFIQSFASNTLAHFAIGSIAGAAVFLLQKSFAWLWIPLALIAAKEIFFDLPNSWGEPLAMIDSAWDLLCYLTGFAFNFWAVMAEPKGGRREQG